MNVKVPFKKSYSSPYMSYLIQTRLLLFVKFGALPKCQSWTCNSSSNKFSSSVNKLNCLHFPKVFLLSSSPFIFHDYSTPWPSLSFIKAQNCPSYQQDG